MKRKPSTSGVLQLIAAATAALLLAQAAWACPKYKVLHAFGKGNDGGGLWNSVTFDKRGNLYGATSGGGAYGYGIVFKLTRHTDGKWTETILHSFKNGDPDGSEPNGGLLQDALGSWYGTTSRDGPYHVGTAFQLAHEPDGWTVNVIYPFGEQSNDGEFPTAGLVMDKSGDLYGTAPYGGSTAFELKLGPDGWHETVLHRFGIRKGDGAAPFAGLIVDRLGNLYGTTEAGGIGCAGEGCGTVYEIEHAATGWHEKVLHYFDNNGRDGVTPGWGALIMDAKGRLYGTTAGGGCCGGVVFKLTPSPDGCWKETILHQFKGGAGGFEAGAGVVTDKAGNLYGTTIYGGTCCGVVYKLAPGSNGKWTYTVLHTFNGYDGAQPDANLILDHKGNLYGTTATGGANGAGVVFELTP